MSLFQAFYARADELSTFLRTVRTARAQDRGAVVLVEGEAGIGKTRLVAELRAATSKEPVAFLIGRSAEYLQAPYEPFIDALDGEADGRSIEDALRAPPARATSSEEERAQRFRLVERFLRKRIATRGTLVLVIEDLHWSDAASLDLFRHLAHRLDDTASVLVATYRESDINQRAGFQAAVERMRREGALTIRLGPWSQEDIRAAVRSALPAPDALSDDLIRLICELAEGRPYIAEELLQEALDGAARGSGDSSIPLLSVRGHVHDRLKSLTNEEQQVLMYAAVVGRDFDVALLARLTDLSDAEILAAIRVAKRVQLVAEDTYSGRFTFRHALTREILYHELLVTEVRILHERIARALEESAGDPPVGIAYHWWAAKNAERAVPANELAGDRALGIAAPADAARFYERALDFAVAGSETRFGLLEKVVQAHNAAGRGQNCLVWCRRAISEMREANRPDDVLRFTLRAAHQEYGMGELAEAKETIRHVRDELGSLPVSGRHLAAELSFAMVLVAEGSAAEALAVLDRAATLGCEWSERERFRYENLRHHAYTALGRFTESLEACRRALEIALASKNAELEILARNNLAVTAMTTGDTRAAKLAYEEVLAAAERFGLRGEHSMIVANLAACTFQIGELAEATRLAERTRLREDTRVAPAILGGAVELRLQTLRDAPERKNEAGIAELVERAFRTGSSELIAATSGAAALAFIADAKPDEARAVIKRAIRNVSSLESAYWLLDAAARIGDVEETATARDLLLAGHAHGENRAAVAQLRLFDARLAEREGHTAEATSFALEAHAAFRAIEWPLEAAAALEVAGDFSGALEAYRTLGATREIRRLEDRLGKRRTRTADDPGLSRREEEVARLIVRGYPNRTIAGELSIGERTVETHVTSICRKLGVRSRTEIAARLADRAS